VTEPIFWLSLSLFLVAISLTSVLMVAFPAFQELARAARSAEKLFDTLQQEFPPTLESLRLTGIEISELTDDLNKGVKSATEVIKQVDQGVITAKQQVNRVQGGTRRLVSGAQAAWQTWQQYPSQQSSTPSPSKDLEPDQIVQSKQNAHHPLE